MQAPEPTGGLFCRQAAWYTEQNNIENKEEIFMYDIIVIGAGPSGSTAAKLLADSGYSVLLLERMALPRYKSCSGCLIKKSMDLVKEYFGTEVPASVTCSPAENRGMFFIDDKGNEYKFGQPGMNVWRSSFDHWLAKQAEKSGAVLWDNAPVLDCADNGTFVTVTVGGTHKQQLQAKYVIDCEGVTGIVKKKLLKTEPKYITTYQTFNEGTIDLDLHYFYAYLQPELSEYDAWFNVKDDLLVLGVTVKNPQNVKQYYAAFIRYMEEKHNLKITRQCKEDRWLLPHIQPGCPIDYGVGRVFFAGEIAGWLNPMGEGISCGMESAYHLAASVREHFDAPREILMGYKQKSAGLHEYMLRQWSLTARMADTFREMK